MKLITPVNEQTLTDIALHYVWESDPQAEYYTVEAAKNPDFLEPVAVKVEALKNCEVGFLLPEDDQLLDAGNWYIRVRSDTGARTDTARITVNTVHSRAPLRRPISPDRPLFTVFDYSQHRKGAEYHVLPDSLKPYADIGCAGPYHGSIFELQDNFMSFDQEGFSWHIGACGPSAVRSGKYVVTPLSVIEYVMQHARNLISTGMLEIYMGVRPHSDWHVRYMNRLVRLCGKYGILFLYTDGNRNDIDFPAVINRDDYMDVFREYSDYVVLSYKQNHSNASYTCYGSILGAWIEGAVGHIGIQAENWYWNDAGFRDDVGHYYGYLQGNEQQIPAPFSAQMLLAGVSLGACYFSLEGEGWLMCDLGNGQYQLSAEGCAVLSMLRYVIDKHLIPSKEEVLSRIHAVIKTEGNPQAWGDAWTGGAFRNAFQDIFQINTTKELFPKELRYYYLPFTTNHPEAFEGYRQISLSDISEPDDMHRILNPLYSKWFEGNAYITGCHGKYIIMNSWENRRLGESFCLSLDQSEQTIISEIKGTVDLWQYILLDVKADSAGFHINAPVDSVLEFEVGFADNNQNSTTKYSGGGVVWSVSDPRAVVRRNSDNTGVIVSMEGNNIPVEIVLMVCSPSSRQLKKIKSFPARLPSRAVAYAACSNIFSWNSFGVRTPKFR